MKISFIIPIYNAEKFIKKCVDSLVCQGLAEDTYEIIMVNDGSIDSSEAICFQLQKEFKAIRYYSKENYGPGHTRNYGLARAKGDYIWFIDADDYLDAGVVNKLLPHIKENIDVYVIGYQAVDVNGAILRTETYPTEVLSTIEALEKEYFINMVWGKLIKRSVLEAQNLRFREDIRGPEDFHFSFRLLSFVETIKMVDLICYNYVENPVSLMNTRSEEHLEKLANDSVTAGKDLKIYLESLIGDVRKKEAFNFWLSNYMYGLFLSLFRFKYSSKFIASILDDLKLSGNYPIKLESKNWKHNIFSKIANSKPIFLFIVAIKRGLNF